MNSGSLWAHLEGATLKTAATYGSSWKVIFLKRLFLSAEHSCKQGWAFQPSPSECLFSFLSWNVNWLVLLYFNPLLDFIYFFFFLLSFFDLFDCNQLLLFRKETRHLPLNDESASIWMILYWIFTAGNLYFINLQKGFGLKCSPLSMVFKEVAAFWNVLFNTGTNLYHFAAVPWPFLRGSSGSWTRTDPLLGTASHDSPYWPSLLWGCTVRSKWAVRFE